MLRLPELLARLSLLAGQQCWVGVDRGLGGANTGAGAEIGAPADRAAIYGHSLLIDMYGVAVQVGPAHGAPGLLKSRAEVPGNSRQAAQAHPIARTQCES
jgi:hypothetical protein